MDITWIGTATALIEHDGFTVLTDPNFLHRGDRAYLGKGLWSKRITDPALELAELPPLDAVVLSHLHGDHWDREARRGLDRTTPVLTTAQSARKLVRQGFRGAVGLGAWETRSLGAAGRQLTVTAVPGRHARGPVQSLLPKVMGSVLSFPDGATVYVTGDTLHVSDLDAIPVRFPDLDVGLWHLGGTRVLGMLVTMDGRQGADVLELVHPKVCLPIHHGDYGVFKDPVETFFDEVQRRGLTGVRPIARGERAHLEISPAS
jgi:L-ascorbate metabolism protein UlaG (beta-lactamase superfamily)